MPIYRYRCDHCGTVHDLYRSIQDADLPPQGHCPECLNAKPKFSKVLTAPSNRYRFCDE